jgi:hypothetical protein
MSLLWVRYTLICCKTETMMFRKLREGFARLLREIKGLRERGWGNGEYQHDVAIL